MFVCIPSAVNDLGGSTSGSGKSSKAADETVSMIRSRGGKAVPDYSKCSVEMCVCVMNMSACVGGVADAGRSTGGCDLGGVFRHDLLRDLHCHWITLLLTHCPELSCFMFFG